ncbi:hypothetical protein Clacol_007089 [Clathrus columnatus]|uniref:CCL2-like lectin domain-containing protein n=1 Tax=Clathrus columnatus TaxID=1419009 RepID=A0AAV5AI80_9AGAM|nr:hypothetical protein Clacol_007089 [Clathrus columnatus]
MKAISIFTATILALSFGVLNAVAQSFALADGTYQFVNRVSDPFGNQLALTSGPVNTVLTLAPFVRNLWVVENTGLGVVISVPSSGGTVEVGFSGTLPQNLMTVEAGGFFWSTTSFGGSITISDTSNSFNWAAPTQTIGAAVAGQFASPTPTLAPWQLWVPILTTTDS